jgi:diphosphomevalonate decarboxylase
MKGEGCARPNVALVKYWGKRDERLNLPTADSISVTLDRLPTTVSVHFRPDLEQDVLILNGHSAPAEATMRVSRFLDRIRSLAGVALRAVVESLSESPVGAGLGSSAAAYAALTLAATRALRLDLDATDLSRLARQGSGSACRSIFGGFVKWSAGDRADGSDSVARRLYPPVYWPIAVLVVIVDVRPKAIGSREAMQRTRATSPLYDGFLRATAMDIVDIEEALRLRNWSRLGPTVEANAHLMHATALAARPPIRFWSPGTLGVFDTVTHLRRQGYTAYVTVDAGPNPVVLCPPEEAAKIAAQLEGVPEVQTVITAGPGDGAA